MLSAEHTWGAQDSHSELARQVEKIKAGYFTRAGTESAALNNRLLSQYQDAIAKGFCVINTLSWNRSGIVTLTKAQAQGEVHIVDDHNQPVLCQRLSSGELIFLANDIPALGSRYYSIHGGPIDTANGMAIAQTLLQNGALAVELNKSTGNIKSVKDLADGYEYADATGGINSYWYVAGVYNGEDRPKTPVTVENASFSVKEKGPLLISVMVRSNAPGVDYLEREIRLFRNNNAIEIKNTLHKVPTKNKESVHIGFSFAIPGGVSRMDMPWSIVEPNKDQLYAANKNWFAIQRWADVSNASHGVTLSPVQAPLIEWGEIAGNILDGARQYSLWKKDLAPSSTLYSFVLNNHWDTNFPLEQGGIINESYALQFHHGYDAVVATRFGLETHRPLLVVQAAKNIIEKPIVRIGHPAIVLSLLKATGGNRELLLRLRSVADSAASPQLSWPSAKPKKIVVCNAAETPMGEIDNNFQVAPFGMATLKLIY